MDEIFSEKLNLDELYKQQKITDDHKLKIYQKILGRVHNKIKHTSRIRNNNKFCVYILPEFILGVPRYDINTCTMYIIEKLKTNGFNIKYTHPNLLFISWKGKTNPKDCKHIETKNKEYKSIEDYNPKTNFIYNNSLLKKLDNNIKISKK